MCYEQGVGLNPSILEAWSWYKKAADKGYAPAMNSLGAICEKKHAVAEAMTWYRKAADRGLLVAQFNLGTILMNQQKYEDAISFCKRQRNKALRQHNVIWDFCMKEDWELFKTIRRLLNGIKRQQNKA